MILPRDFYARPTAEVARALLGKVIAYGGSAGRIVETEAYLGVDDRGRVDLAAHSAAGVTARTRVLFGPPGHAYVYLSYGIHECLNIVAEPEGVPGCVLIRALDPVLGLEQMRARRPTAKTDTELASGPGKLTRALGITRREYGADLTCGALTVREDAGGGTGEIVTATRIGVSVCADWPLRFYIRDNPCVSKRRLS